MNLHQNEELFSEIITRASQTKENGGLGINPSFLEKDYWITRSLQLLSQSKSKEFAVFKGGTSLSKIYGIGSRFSEDIDIAVLRDATMSDAKLKSVIRSTEKAMSQGLREIVRPGLTSNGSRFRKSYFAYPQAQKLSLSDSLLSGQLLIEINSFANPWPFHLQKVNSLIQTYLIANGLNDIIEEFDLHSFTINVLDKRTTLIEKLVSLIRFSLSSTPVDDLSAKIRHFYDLHFLLQDDECKAYLSSDKFLNDFQILLNHDREQFDNPTGWQCRTIQESPLITDFHRMWTALSGRYQQELPSLAYNAIPGVLEIESSISSLLKIVAKAVI